MITLHYTPSFLKQLKKLEPSLQAEVFEKVKLFEVNQNNPQLKTHKLNGKLKGSFSFSVNYQYRIVFEKLNKKEFVLVAVGNHDIYKR